MIPEHNTDKLQIQFTIEIEAPPEKVWAKMATVEAMNQWLARNLVFEHEVGGSFQMEGETPQEGPYRFSGQVVKVDPARELTFTWKSEIGEANEWPVDTLVSFQLQAIDTGTRVTLLHTGFEALGAALGKSSFEGHVEGWTQANTLNSLKEAAEAI